MAKTAPPDVARFKANKGRVNDYFEYNVDAVRAKKTVLFAAKAFEEMSWLCAEIIRLGGALIIDDAPRFQKVAKFVTRVCDENANAIASGQFVKVRADVFSAWRFLVRSLETVLKSMIDEDDQVELGGRLTSEDGDRIVLDLEDGLGDDEDDELTVQRSAGRTRPPQGDDVPGGG